MSDKIYRLMTIGGVTYNVPYSPAGCHEPPVVKIISKECNSELMVDVPDTYTWDKWLNYATLGFENPVPEILANFIRDAATEFASRTQVLLRETSFKAQEGERTYHLELVDFESVAGVRKVILAESDPCISTIVLDRNSIDFRYNVSSKALTLVTYPIPDAVYIAYVWAKPSPDACRHDVILYDEHKTAIVNEGRRRYAVNKHPMDIKLHSVLPTELDFERAIAKARVTYADQVRPPLKSRSLPLL